MIYWHKRAKDQHFNLPDCEFFLFLFFCLFVFCFGFVFTFIPSDRTNSHLAFLFGAWHDHASRGELVKPKSGT